MKVNTPLTLLCLTVALAASETTAPAMESADTKANSVVAGATKDGIELAVSLPKQAATKRAIPLHIRLANNGDNSVRFHRQPMPWRDWDIEILNEQGKKCALTPEGRKLVGEAPDILTYGAVFMPLHSLETHTWLLDLSKLYELKTGKYRMSVSGAIASKNGFVIKVKDVEFEIIDGKANKGIERPKQKE